MTVRFCFPEIQLGIDIAYQFSLVHSLQHFAISHKCVYASGRTYDQAQFPCVLLVGVASMLD